MMTWPWRKGGHGRAGTLIRLASCLFIASTLSACLETAPSLNNSQLAAIPGPAVAAAAPAPVTGDCNDPANFAAWLAAFKQDAVAQGIKPQTIEVALDGVSYDSMVVFKDRNQGHFSIPFSDFANDKVGHLQLAAGKSALSRNEQLLAGIEQRYGVPGSVLVAIWGLESLYGTYTNNSDVVRSIATLAFDCRRPQLFRPQLVSALRIVERGDLSREQMRGGWAGEMGQTQFMATDYYESAVDHDGDGKRDLKDSAADALASTANVFAKRGWKRGQLWIEEVRVPADLDWKEADVAIQHPRSSWAARGVTKADGAPLVADSMPASLILPMGRNGPAFLAYDNFKVYLKWNQSLTYSLTAAYFATRLDGAPSFRDGNGKVAPFGFDLIVALQRSLAARGYDVGAIDGRLGAKTRAAIKDLQIKSGRPADSYPTPELFDIS